MLVIVVIVVALVGVGAFFVLGSGDDDGGTASGGGTGAGVGVTVSGTSPWSDTGIDLQTGDVFTVEATGEVHHDPGAGSVSGPDGVPDRPDLDQFNVTGAADHNALIGRIGESGEPFLVGSTATYTVSEPGRLYFGVNDSGTDNNSGAYTATVSVTPA